MIKVLTVGGKARCGAFSPDGNHLAVGLASGALQVYEFYPNLKQIHWSIPFKGAVSVLAYSPDGRHLAAGSHDQSIELFGVASGYKRVGRLLGHSSSLRSMDWSADGAKLMTMDQVRAG